MASTPPPTGAGPEGSNNPQRSQLDEPPPPEENLLENVDANEATFKDLLKDTRGLKVGEVKALEVARHQRHTHSRLVGEEVGTSKQEVGEDQRGGDRRRRKDGAERQRMAPLPKGSPVWFAQNRVGNLHSSVMALSFISEEQIKWHRGFSKNICATRCRLRYVFGKATSQMERAGFITKSDAEIQAHSIGAYHVAIALVLHFGFVNASYRKQLRDYRVVEQLPSIEIGRQKEAYAYVTAFDTHYHYDLPFSQADPTVIALAGWLWSSDSVNDLLPPGFRKDSGRHRDVLCVTLHEIMSSTNKGATTERGVITFKSSQLLKQQLQARFDPSRKFKASVLPEDGELLTHLSPFAKYAIGPQDRQERAKEILDLPSDRVYGPASVFGGKKIRHTPYWGQYLVRLFGSEPPNPPTNTTPMQGISLRRNKSVNACCDIYVNMIEEFFEHLPPWDLFISVDARARLLCQKGDVENLRRLQTRFEAVVRELEERNAVKIT